MGSATPDRSRLTQRKSGSPSELCPKPTPFAHASHFQTRFAVETAHQPHPAPSAAAAASADGNSDSSTAGVPLQAIPSLLPVNRQPTSLQASHSLQDRLTNSAAAPTALSSETLQPSSVKGETSPQTLQLPFGQLQTALTPGLPNTFQPPEQESNRPHSKLAPSTAKVSDCVPMSAQGMQQLSLKARTSSLRNGTLTKGCQNQWEATQTSIDNPEKQELGRRECLRANAC